MHEKIGEDAAPESLSHPAAEDSFASAPSGDGPLEESPAATAVTAPVPVAATPPIPDVTGVSSPPQRGGLASGNEEPNPSSGEVAERTLLSARHSFVAKCGFLQAATPHQGCRDFFLPAVPTRQAVAGCGVARGRPVSSLLWRYRRFVKLRGGRGRKWGAIFGGRGEAPPRLWI